MGIEILNKEINKLKYQETNNIKWNDNNLDGKYLLNQCILFLTQEDSIYDDLHQVLITCYKPEGISSYLLIKELEKRFFVNIPQNILKDQEKKEYRVVT